MSIPMFYLSWRTRLIDSGNHLPAVSCAIFYGLILWKNSAKRSQMNFSRTTTSEVAHTSFPIQPLALSSRRTTYCRLSEPTKHKMPVIECIERQRRQVSLVLWPFSLPRITWMYTTIRLLSWSMKITLWISDSLVRLPFFSICDVADGFQTVHLIHIGCQILWMFSHGHFRS